MGFLLYALFATAAAFPGMVPGLAPRRSAHRWVTSTFVYILSLISMGAAMFGVAYATSNVEVYAFFVVVGITVLCAPPVLLLRGPWPTRFFCVWHGLVQAAMSIIIVAGLGMGTLQSGTDIVAVNLVGLFCAVCALTGIVRILWPKPPAVSS